jgi:hypothetical protein
LGQIAPTIWGTFSSALDGSPIPRGIGEKFPEHLGKVSPNIWGKFFLEKYLKKVFKEIFSILL